MVVHLVRSEHEQNQCNPPGCLGACEGAEPQPDGEVSGGGGCCSWAPLRRNEGASGVNASLDNKHSRIGISVGVGLWFVLLKELVWSWDLLP